MRADDVFPEVVQPADEPLQEILRSPGTCSLSRVAIRTNAISPTATIQVPTIELLMGKRRGGAISTAFVRAVRPPVRRRLRLHRPARGSMAGVHACRAADPARHRLVLRERHARTSVGQSTGRQNQQRPFRTHHPILSSGMHSRA